MDLLHPRRKWVVWLWWGRGISLCVLSSTDFWWSVNFLEYRCPLGTTWCCVLAPPFFWSIEYIKCTLMALADCLVYLCSSMLILHLKKIIDINNWKDRLSSIEKEKGWGRQKKKWIQKLVLFSSLSGLFAALIKSFIESIGLWMISSWYEVVNLLASKWINKSDWICHVDKRWSKDNWPYI